MRTVLAAALRAFFSLLGAWLELRLGLRLGRRGLNPRWLGHALRLHLRHAMLHLVAAQLFLLTQLHFFAALLFLLALLHLFAALLFFTSLQLLLALLLGSPGHAAIATLRRL